MTHIVWVTIHSPQVNYVDRLLSFFSFNRSICNRGSYNIYKIALRIRGGKSSKSALRKTTSRSSSVSSRRKASVSSDDDDDDNDDDDEDEDDREPPRKSKSKTTSKSKGKSPPPKGRSKDVRSRMELIPWGQSANTRKGKPKSLGFREKLEDLAKHGQSAYKDVYRRAKVSFVNAAALF